MTSVLLYTFIPLLQHTPLSYGLVALIVSAGGSISHWVGLQKTAHELVTMPSPIVYFLRFAWASVNRV
jgi:hypothetical protein